MPHILMEEGDMTPAEYERHLKGKKDFIKGTKKDPSAAKKVRSTSCRWQLRLGLELSREGLPACLQHWMLPWPNEPCSIFPQRGASVEDEGKTLQWF